MFTFDMRPTQVQIAISIYVQKPKTMSEFSLKTIENMEHYNSQLNGSE